MKILLRFAFPLALLFASIARINAQNPPTSTLAVEGILSRDSHRAELTRLNASITTVLADQRLTDAAVRQMLSESQVVFTEMLNQKDGSNAGKLIELAKWQQTQSLEKHAIHDDGSALTPQQQFVLDNPLAGQEVYLTSIIHWISNEYLQRDGDAAGPAKLEGYLQLYLNFRQLVEGGHEMPDELLFCAPQWIQSRFPALSVDQKRQLLKDVNEARAAKAIPASDSEAAPPPTAQEQAAYDAVYQFIVANTPQS